MIALPRRARPIIAIAAVVAACISAKAQPAPAALLQANEFISSGNFTQAEANLRTYILTNPGSANAHYLLAYTLLRQNRPKDSLAEYTSAAALEPPSAGELRSVGQDYVLLADYDDASKWITRSVQLSPNDPESWYALGRLRYTQQQYVDATKCFEHAQRLAPESVKIENNLGLAYEGLNRTDDAVAAYRRAIALQDAAPPAHASEQPLLNLAIVLLHRGDDAAALLLLLRAETFAPRDPQIQEQLGQANMQQGNFLEAARHLELATRLDPDKSNLHFLLGQAYRHLGRPQEAKEQFDAAARLALPASTP